MLFEDAQVEAYAGHKGLETPRRVRHRGRIFTVAEVLDRWYESGLDPERLAHTYFKVRTEEGAVLMLKLQEETGRWYIRVPREPVH